MSDRRLKVRAIFTAKEATEAAMPKARDLCGRLYRLYEDWQASRGDLAAESEETLGILGIKDLRGDDLVGELAPMDFANRRDAMITLSGDAWGHGTFDRLAKGIREYLSADSAEFEDEDGETVTV